MEALGIAVTYAAQVLNHLDMEVLVTRMSNRQMRLPGDLLISMIDAGDGPYLAAVESRDAEGTVTVNEYRDDARNFFEAYGWALSEQPWSRDVTVTTGPSRSRQPRHRGS
jgi:hypothetical protein